MQISKLQSNPYHSKTTHMTKPPTLLGLLKNPVYALLGLGFAFLFFDIQFYIMATMPGYRDLMCVEGAGLTLENIIFAAIISLATGLFVVGFYHTLKMRASSYRLLSLSGAGALIGSVTVFCPACALPVLSVFGFGIGLSFLTTYNLAFKILSLVLIAVGLYQVNKQVMGTCESCVK